MSPATDEITASWPLERCRAGKAACVLHTKRGVSTRANEASYPTLTADREAREASTCAVEIHCHNARHDVLDVLNVGEERVHRLTGAIDEEIEVEVIVVGYSIDHCTTELAHKKSGEFAAYMHC